MTSFTAGGAELLPHLQELRRRIHRHPEVGLDLPLTQQLILDELDGLDLEIVRGTATSSVVAILRGGEGGSGEGPVVLLRGDMDALPIREEASVPFASENDAMHACGHDLHVAGLIGAAKLLCAHRADLPGTVVFMFQPGEEGDGGAEVMIKEEALLEVAGRPIDAAYALHVMAGMPAGVLSTRTGTTCAGCQSMTIVVHGRGGHGSRPHEAVDPVPILAQTILGMQAYVARHVDIHDPIVLSVTQLMCDSPINVIPASATFRAEVRHLSRESLERLHEDLPRLAQGIASAYGGSAEVTFDGSYPATINDTVETERAVASLRRLFGDELVEIQDKPIMGSEDFSYVLEQVPGCFVRIGARPAGTLDEYQTNHSTFVQFDDGVLGDQAAALAQLAWDRIHGEN